MTYAVSSRRRLLLTAAASAAFAACSRARRQSGSLCYLLPNEPDTLDPCKSAGGSEVTIMSALFEPLLQPDPETMAPVAGLATHYKVERGGTRYTFYLRGHPAPEGIVLADAEPARFSRGRTASRDVPARWSDGISITAHDVVCSFRRYLAPLTANPLASTLYSVAGAEAVSTGKIPPEQLGVRALDTFAFQVDLRAPEPTFLKMCYSFWTLPLPCHAIDSARAQGREASWTEPGHMVTSGPFLLKESRVHERVVVSKNPNYFDAPLVRIEEIHFFADDGATALKLFQAGMVDSMDGRVLPLQFVPRMRKLAELHMGPGCACHNWRISTKRPPLDNVFLRYALNMATDKDATARFLGAGQRPAKSRVPPLEGYRSLQSLPVEINGRTCDVLAYDPRGARELWAGTASAEAHDPLPIHYVPRVDSQLLAEILQSQWRENLGLETRLMPQEPGGYYQIIVDGDFTGVAEDAYIAGYPDPYDLLSLYTATYANWSDSEYDHMLAAATSTADSALRMEKLAACEERLLRAMPLIPLYFDTWVYLERPEVHGLKLNLVGTPGFKYAWVDTSWRRT